MWATLGLGLAASLTLQPSYALSRVDDLAAATPVANPAPTQVAAVSDPSFVGSVSSLEKTPTSVTPDQVKSAVQLSQVLNVLLKSVDSQIAHLSATKADASEMAMLQQLQNQLSTQLKATVSTSQDLQGRLSVVEAKEEEHENRLSLLEKVQIHGDMTVGGLADFASAGTGRGRDGIRDAMSALGRVRLTVDVPVVEDKPESVIGAGTIHARLIAAFGRYSPLAGQRDNQGSIYPLNLYSRVSTDVSAFNEGYGTGSVGNLFGNNGNTLLTRPNVYLESTFYKQHFKHGIPLLTKVPFFNPTADEWKSSGDLYAGLVRWWDLFDVSPYRGNEMTQFQNNAFINIPGNAVNNNMPMVGYVFHQGLGKSASLDLSTAVGSPDVGDIANAMNATYEARLNYTTTFLGSRFAKPGSFYVGGYHAWQAGSRRITDLVSSLTNRGNVDLYPGLNQRSSLNAFYVGWNQEWYKGIGTSIGYLLNNNSPTLIAMTTMQPGPATVAAGIRQSLSGVLSVPMSAIPGKFRDQDLFGFGYAFVDPHEGGISSDAMEHVMEAFYRVQVNDKFAIIPSVQMITNRLGLRSNDVATVLGLRASYSF